MSPLLYLKLSHFPQPSPLFPSTLAVGSRGWRKAAALSGWSPAELLPWVKRCRRCALPMTVTLGAVLSSTRIGSQSPGRLMLQIHFTKGNRGPRAPSRDQQRAGSRPQNCS